MDRTPVEIFYAIASELGTHDLINFRLTNMLFASIGATYLIPEITFRMHPSDLQRLEAISLHPVFSKHVRTLTYLAEALHSPRLSWLHFARDQNLEIRLPTRPARPNIPPTQYLLEYQKYCDALTEQDRSIEEGNDMAVLREVLPRFPNLDTFRMSAGLLMEEANHWTRRKSPYSDFIAGALTKGIHPEGKRPLETLLMANVHAPCALKNLQAGSLHWEFFNQREENLARMFQPLANLTSIQLSINADPVKVGPFGIHPNGANFNPLRRCQVALGKGAVSKVLASLPRLQYLCVDVLNSDSDQAEKGAWLKDIIEPGFHWPNLKELALGGISSNRAELIDVLLIHKNTLRTLCLRHISLASTSWWEFLPDIRSSLNLEDVCICGNIWGRDEGQDEPNFQTWGLSIPEVFSYGDDDMMRESINMYCRRGGEGYPNVVPLTDSIVGQYYKTYVKPAFPREELPDYEGDTDSDSSGDAGNLEANSDKESEDGILHGASMDSMTRENDDFLALQMMMAGMERQEDTLQNILNHTVDTNVDRMNLLEDGMGPPPWLLEGGWFADDDDELSATDSDEEAQVPAPQ